MEMQHCSYAASMELMQFCTRTKLYQLKDLVVLHTHQLNRTSIDTGYICLQMDTGLQITLQMSSYYMSVCGYVKCFQVRVCSMSIAGTYNPDAICKCQYIDHFINIWAGIIVGPYTSNQ
jgi:hypothetical protein